MGIYATMINRSLAHGLGYILIAAALLAISYYETRISYTIKLVMVMVGIAAAIAGVLCAIDWIIYRGVINYQIYKRAASITPVTLLAERLAGMDLAHLDATNQLLLTADAIPGLPTPAILYRSPFGDIPGGFITEFFNHSTDKYLAPVSTWGEGTNKYKYAKSLVSTMIYLGYATAAHGPYPAKWVDLQGASKYYGVSK